MAELQKERITWTFVSHKATSKAYHLLYRGEVD